MLKWGFIAFIAFCGLTKGQKNSPDEVEKLMDLTQKRILDLEANVDELIQKSSLPNWRQKLGAEMMNNLKRKYFFYLPVGTQGNL